MVREKYRYIVFRIKGGKAISAADLEKAIQDSASSNLSDWDYAMTAPKMKVVEYYPVLEIGIVKVLLSGVSHMHEMLKSPLSIRDVQFSATAEKTSGIIKKAKKWILKKNSLPKRRKLF
ncbi:ribonuclease P/MRP protein subunit POP5 [Nematocida major]|uniref:ribonuclease P/MRP protein subunit POP5 n=1 Tax=Nematocida major TaxID=1912982 RepID=UPI0020077680|nr:ribonuclease P/MRP protein subunit POP5 [Nematocida major]KAH9386743.1 ribonuclease P/MRP protein subunit POP5 [Nematocida major]